MPGRSCVGPCSSKLRNRRRTASEFAWPRSAKICLCTITCIYGRGLKSMGCPLNHDNYFFTLWDTFAVTGTLRLLLAEYEGNTIAGIILFASDTTLHYAYGASDEHHLKLAPNNLLYWDAITWGCEQGYKVFDLGRTARDNEGLMEFKRRWGAIQEPLPVLLLSAYCWFSLHIRKKPHVLSAYHSVEQTSTCAYCPTGGIALQAYGITKRS